MGERGYTKMFLNAEYLTELMRLKGWTVRQLALKSGLSSATISRIITGKRGAGTRTLAGIRRAFPEEPIERLLFY
jgi:transcriptional regulator with XRE-family HTH domain